MNVTSVTANKNTYSLSGSAASAAPYPESVIKSFAKSSDKASANVGNENFYGKAEAMAAFSAESIAEQKKEFECMYITSAAHSYFSKNRLKASTSMGLFNLRAEIAGEANKKDCIPVPIEAGELPQFIDTIEASLKEGKSLSDILKQKYDEHISRYGEEGHTNSFADWFAINASTGEVMSADPISRSYHGDSFDEELTDVEAVMELADDLETFLRYAVFDRNTDDSEKVDKLISFIKNKQAYANYDRFLSDNGEAASDTILQALIAAGVLKSDEEDDEDDEEEKEKSVDELMEAIRIHQEELREIKIDMEESNRAIAEIQEIIDSETNNKTVN